MEIYEDINDAGEISKDILSQDDEKMEIDEDDVINDAVEITADINTPEPPKVRCLFHAT